jgi:hypothetical protein
MKAISASLLLSVLFFSACGQKPAADTTAVTAAPPSIPVPEATPPAPAPRLSVEANIDQWKMHPSQMDDEMSHDHRVVRMRPPTEPLPQYAKSEAMEAYIRQRLQADPLLAKADFNVGVERVVATLTGRADSMEQIGRAMAVVLDTEGISEVISELTLPEPRAETAAPGEAMPHG